MWYTSYLKVSLLLIAFVLFFSLILFYLLEFFFFHFFILELMLHCQALFMGTDIKKSEVFDIRSSDNLTFLSRNTLWKEVVILTFAFALTYTFTFAFALIFPFSIFLSQTFLDKHQMKMDTLFPTLHQNIRLLHPFHVGHSHPGTECQTSYHGGYCHPVSFSRVFVGI